MKLLKCKYCGNDDIEGIELDKHAIGFWCESCDGYTHLHKETEHKFLVVLESKVKGEDIKVDVGVKLRKQVSPLRYPGGKSRLIDYVFSKLDTQKIETFVEPFVGGGSVGLSLLDAGLIENLIINDLDFGIYSFFNTIKNNPDFLIEKVQNTQLTHEDFFTCQKIVESKYENTSELNSAWAFFVVNRLAFSGIYDASPTGGKSGSVDKLLRRWNKDTIVKKIRHINSMGDKITVYNKDALEIIEEEFWTANCTLFVDPPYVAKGKELYNHYYTEKDHLDLKYLLESLYYGCNGADILVTYDDDVLIEKIYSLPVFERINRAYSI